MGLLCAEEGPENVSKHQESFLDTLRIASGKLVSGPSSETVYDLPKDTSGLKSRVHGLASGGQADCKLGASPTAFSHRSEDHTHCWRSFRL